MRKIDCKHYDDEFGCCKILSDWSDPMPTLQPCVENPCKYYEKECEFCKKETRSAELARKCIRVWTVVRAGAIPKNVLHISL
jgi:hypothetical protein